MILLFYYEQLSLREVAAILGISIVAVKGRLHKARKQLKEQLLTYYDEWTKEDTLLQQRSRTMVKMSIVDVVTKVRKEDLRHFFSTLVLLDEVGHRALGIWIGEAEAAMIDMGLRKSAPIRPMTMNFMASVLKAAGATLEEVRIETLKDEIFYAVAKIRNGDTVQELDARPSDAIALAVVTDAPIYAAEEILEKCGVALPEGKTLHRLISENLPQGSDAPLEELAAPDLPTKEDYDKWLQQVLSMLMR